MAAKQKHIQRVKQRIIEKLKSLDDQEEAYYTVIHENVAKVRQQAQDLLQLEDSSQFLSRYNRVIQVLDACYNNLELLTADAEDRLDSEGAADVFVDTSGLETRSLADESTQHSPTSIAGYDSLIYRDFNADKTLTQEGNRIPSPVHSVEEKPMPIHKTPPSQARLVRPLRDAVPDSSDQAERQSLGDCSSQVEVKSSVSSSTKFTEKDTLSACSYQNKQTEGISRRQSDWVETVCSNKNKKSKAIPKQDSVPIGVKKQLRQTLEPVIESDSSFNPSQVDSLEDSSAFEEKVSAASSPKKKSKKSKKRGCHQKTKISPNKADLSKHKQNKEKSVSLEKMDSDFVRVTSGQQEAVSAKEGWTLVVDNKDKQVGSEKVKEPESVKKKILEKDTREDFQDSTKTDRRLLQMNSDEKGKNVLKDDSLTSNNELTSTQIDSSVTNEKDKENCERKQMGSISSNEKVKQKDNSSEIEVKDTLWKNFNAATGSKEKSLSVSVPTSEAAKQDGKENFQCTEKPRVSQGTLLEKEATPVIVSEIINPWCFYVQRCCTSLNGLMEEICTYMAVVGLSQKPLDNPNEGMLCLALFSKDNLYYRAIITRVYKAVVTEVDVIYIDYGNRERVKANKLRALPDHLTLLPAQAICCALAEVMPCNKYNEWREEDIFTFSQYVLQKQLECVPVCKNSEKNMPNLVKLFIHAPVPAVAQPTLYMTKICIGTILVSGGLAKDVGITEQVRMIMKFMEDMGDFVFTLGSSDSSGVEIKELMDSPVCGTASMKKLETQMKASVSLDLNKVVKEITDDTPKPETENAERSLISPRSECSDTESQRDMVVKAPEKTTSPVDMKEEVNLPEIKEEDELDIADLDKGDPAGSVCGSMEMLDTMSSVTELDTSDARSIDTGFHSSDFNFNLDLNPQGHEIMLSHVKSPSLFYVHVVSRQIGHTLDRLMKCLNQQFEKMNKKSLARLSKSFKPAENKLCCAQFTQDNCFYRAVVKKLPKDSADKKTKSKVHVFYMDFGDDEWIAQSRLFPLPEPFIYLPPLVLKCSLAYIKPLGHDKNGSCSWSDKAVATFATMATLEKRLLMHVVHGSLSADRKGQLVGDDSSIGVLLIDNIGEEEVCINMDLIRQGIAELDTSDAAVDKQDVSEAMEGFNPMEEDYFSERNSYNIDVDDAGVATTGYKAQDERRLCKFFNRGSCWRGERCPWRHVKSASGVTMDQEPLYFVYNNQESLLPEVHCWVAMEISTILTPGHFYAILPMGNKSLDCTDSTKDSSEIYGELKETETLDDLQASLNEEYGHKSSHERTLILRAPGEIVAAKFQQDHHWYRARVLQSTEEKVKVFYLDFGNTEWISARDTYEIQPEYLHLPFQAIECFLHNVEPVGDGDTWNKEAKAVFRELVDGKTLVGHVRSMSWNGCISVELYDTTGKDDINITDTLVERGFAARTTTFTETETSSTKSSIVMIPG